MDWSCRLGWTRNDTVGAHRAEGGGGIRRGSRPPASIRQCCRWHVVQRARNATDSGRTWALSSDTCGLRVELGRVGHSRVSRTISRSVSEGEPSAMASRTTRTRSRVPSCAAEEGCADLTRPEGEKTVHLWGGRGDGVCRSVSSATVTEVLLAGCTTVVPSGRYDPSSLGIMVRSRTNAHWMRTRNDGRKWAMWDQGWSTCVSQ